MNTINFPGKSTAANAVQKTLNSIGDIGRLDAESMASILNALKTKAGEGINRHDPEVQAVANELDWIALGVEDGLFKPRMAA